MTPQPPRLRVVCSSIRNGFTLAELLAGASALALLLAALAPSLEDARNQTRNSVCLDRLRAIGAASLTYADSDPSGFSIPVHWRQYYQCDDLAPGELCDNPLFVGAYEWGGKSGIGGPYLDGAPNPERSRYSTAQGFGPTARPLNHVMYPHGFRDAWSGGVFNRRDGGTDTQLQLDAFRCPADDGPPLAAHCPDWVANPTRSSYDHFGTSFAANIFMTAPGGGGEMRSNSPYLRPVSRVPNPARTLHYEENIGRWAWACKNEQLACVQNLGLEGVDPGPTKALRGWHGKDWTFNRVFIDAHAETQRIYLEGTEDSQGYAQHYFAEELLSYPPFGCGEQYPGSFEQYLCIIVRGPGWQKDTMPSTPVCTGLLHNTGGRPSYENCVTNE